MAWGSRLNSISSLAPANSSCWLAPTVPESQRFSDSPLGCSSQQTVGRLSQVALRAPSMHALPSRTCLTIRCCTTTSVSVSTSNTSLASTKPSIGRTMPTTLSTCSDLATASTTFRHDSVGLKQKTGLILGLIRPFTVMLVDEPFVGLDTPGQETLVEIMSDVVAQGATIICSTHQLDLVPSATRCVGLRDGELAYDGPATAAKIRELVGGE